MHVIIFLKITQELNPADPPWISYHLQDVPTPNSGCTRLHWIQKQRGTTREAHSTKRTQARKVELTSSLWTISNSRNTESHRNSILSRITQKPKARRREPRNCTCQSITPRTAKTHLPARQGKKEKEERSSDTDRGSSTQFGGLIPYRSRNAVMRVKVGRVGLRAPRAQQSHDARVCSSPRWDRSRISYGGLEFFLATVEDRCGSRRGSCLRGGFRWMGFYILLAIFEPLWYTFRADYSIDMCYSCSVRGDNGLWNPLIILCGSFSRWNPMQYL